MLTVCLNVAIPVILTLVLIPTPPFTLIFGTVPLPAKIFTLPLSREIFVLVLLSVNRRIVSTYKSLSAERFPPTVTPALTDAFPKTVRFSVALSVPIPTELL